MSDSDFRFIMTLLFAGFVLVMTIDWWYKKIQTDREKTIENERRNNKRVLQEIRRNHDERFQTDDP